MLKVSLSLSRETKLVLSGRYDTHQYGMRIAGIIATLEQSFHAAAVISL